MIPFILSSPLALAFVVVMAVLAYRKRLKRWRLIWVSLACLFVAGLIGAGDPFTSFKGRTTHVSVGMAPPLEKTLVTDSSEVSDDGHADQRKAMLEQWNNAATEYLDEMDPFMAAYKAALSNDADEARNVLASASSKAREDMLDNTDNPKVYAAFKDIRDAYNIALDALGCEGESCRKWALAKETFLDGKREMDSARAEMKLRYANIGGNPAVLKHVGE